MVRRRKHGRVGSEPSAVQVSRDSDHAEEESRLTLQASSVQGLESGSHEIALGQTADDCGNAGITLDYATLSTAVGTPSESWR